jgi:hypothetical protein
VNKLDGSIIYLQTTGVLTASQSGVYINADTNSGWYKIGNLVVFKLKTWGSQNYPSGTEIASGLPISSKEYIFPKFIDNVLMAYKAYRLINGKLYSIGEWDASTSIVVGAFFV